MKWIDPEARGDVALEGVGDGIMPMDLLAMSTGGSEAQAAQGRIFRGFRIVRKL